MTLRIILAIALTASAASAQTFPVAGVLLDANTRKPLKRYRVTISPSAERTQEAGIVTADDGRFFFSAPKGNYFLSAEHGGDRQSYGMKVLGSAFGNQVVVGLDRDTSHLEFLWFPSSAIYGKIADSSGEPIENARVQLVRSSIVNGQRRNLPAVTKFTDDTGSYRFGPVTSGIYYLQVTAEPWYAVSESNAGAPPGNELGYAPAYYPNTTNPNSAAPLTLRAGDVLRADFTMIKTRGAAVTVRWSGNSSFGSATLTGVGIVNLDFSPRPSYGRNMQTWRAVAPGRYIVRATVTGADGQMSVRKTIEVGGADISVDLTTLPPPKVSGTITYKDSNRKSSSALSIRLVDDSAASVTRSVEPDGTFSFPSIAPGNYRAVLTASPGFVISQMTAEGATVENGAIEIVEGAQIKLNVLVSDESGELTGFVTRGETAVEGVLTVLFPRGGSTLASSRAYQTDTDGSFDFKNVPAGDYVLFAVEQADLEYANAEAVKPYLSAARPVRIEARGRATERIAITPPHPSR